MNNNDNMNLIEAIKFMTEERDDELYTLTDRIRLYFGTEEEHIKQLRKVLRLNYSLRMLTDGLNAVNDANIYNKFKTSKTSDTKVFKVDLNKDIDEQLKEIK